MPNTFPFYDAEPYWPKGGYGHHGEEEGSDSAATTDFYVFVPSFDTAAPQLKVMGRGNDDSFYLESEPMTIDGAFCYHYKDCPVGALIHSSVIPMLFYGDSLAPTIQTKYEMGDRPLYCPRPLDDLYIVGYFGEAPK